ncbi:MAG: bifunctional diguanylate cyclase/phosphodiesterase [Treponema sp.]|nr:bifunctional diguanylate cyclase/phosphodiesterase [Candidatus Treponema equifaecale]
MKKKQKIISFAVVLFAMALMFSALAYFVIQYWNATASTYKPVSYKDSIGKTVLYLNSFSDDYDTSRAQYTAISKKLSENGIFLNAEYMEMDKYNTNQNLKNFHASFGYKVSSGLKYDAVIACSSEALEFIRLYEKEFFKNIPIVYFSVNDSDLCSFFEKNRNMIGLSEENILEQLLISVLNIEKNKRHVVILTDDSVSGLADQKQCLLLRDSFPQYSFTILSSSRYSWSEYCEIVSKLDESHILICLGCYKDGEGNFHSITNIAGQLSDIAQTPIYTNLDRAVGNGFAGGLCIDYGNTAGTAAEIISKVLKGDSLRKYRNENQVSSFYKFDCKKLSQFKIKSSNLPANSKFVNSKKEFFVRHRQVLIPLAMIIIAFTLFLMVSVNYGLNLRKFRVTIDKHSTHDSLTGLLNRSSAKLVMEKHIVGNVPFSVILVDLDEFKIINDLYFHSCGDALLLEMAARFKNLFKDYNVSMARCFSDNFIIILKNIRLKETDVILYDLVQEIHRTFKYGDIVLNMTASIGVEVCDGLTKTSDEVLSNLDMAVDSAKAAGRNTIVFFSGELKEKLRLNKEIGIALDDAVINNGFSVAYQPQIDAKTGEVCGYEALSRLTSGKYNPAQFIPVAEKNGAIPKIGRVITEKAIRQMARWKKEGIPLRKMAINYSAAQMADSEYVAFLDALLDEYEIPPEMVQVEITESLFMGQDAKAKELFHSLKEIGVKLALDDFGTGYSSLSYLTYLPVDTIKIDKSLVDTYLHEETEGFIASLSSLIHSLNMSIVVEGVEEEWQFRKLKKWGFDYIQGYLFSRPISGEEAGIFKPVKYE